MWGEAVRNKHQDVNFVGEVILEEAEAVEHELRQTEEVLLVLVGIGGAWVGSQC
jgi:hypothetical protein